MNTRLTTYFATVLIVAVLCPAVQAETGYEAWLRYAAPDDTARSRYGSLPATVTVLDDSPLLASAQSELVRGVQGMLGRGISPGKGSPKQPALVLGTLEDLKKSGAALRPPSVLSGDGYWLTTARLQGSPCIVITSLTDRGVLYGAFAWLSMLARNQDISHPDRAESPLVPLRWINQWDNLDGSIERGYGGRSIFFENGAVRSDLSRTRDYARLLASIGINGCVINNVNASPNVLADAFIPQLARVADEFRPWGIRLGLSVNFASPKLIGGLDTFDPVDPKVAAWWKEKVDEIYRAIPDFGGFVLKADSEGQLGPATYGRTPADAANVVARALKPHGGYVFYRAFVYNHHLDWTNLKNDRAKAAYDNFHPLDGKFDDNVIIQIKHGPIDFQVREPVSPLFGGLEKTNEAIELQITQEYLGQQRHLVFIAPMWKSALDFDLRVNSGHTPVKEIVAGKTFHRPTGGFAGVANVGLDSNWLGSPLAMANLYGFGRLAWNPDLSAKTIADEWTRLTFGNDPKVVQTIVNMQLRSWRTYENYTGPLGLGTLTNILGPHYGPGIESAERNGWGQWIRADHAGLGMDRTVATGTGYIGQYPPDVQKEFEPLVKCPDELLLFFHHVPYTYLLRSGKTVIQHIYDSHYEGAASAAQYISEWELLKGRIDNERYTFMLAKLQYQAGHAIVWRDAITNWFLKTSGIPDAQGRVGHYPDRIEAESMQLKGYQRMDVVPWETASGGQGVECPAPLQSCTASFRFTGNAGTHDMDVEYFDQNNGSSKFRVYVGDQLVDQWLADAHLPGNKPDGDSSTRRHIAAVTLHPGDEIRIEGIPDAGERAPLDYIAIDPRSSAD
jgi:alpha-glucuronidase